MLCNIKVIQLLTVIIITSLINTILVLDTCTDVIGSDCRYCSGTNYYPVSAYYLQNCSRSCRICTELNVALNNPTKQSSTYSDSRAGYDESLSLSSNAVDGDTDDDWDNGYCTHTRNDKSSWWCVDLQQIYNILYIKLFNRDSNKDRLRGFDMKTNWSGHCNQAGFTSATSCYKDTSSTVQDIYTIERCNQPTLTSISARTVYVTVSSQPLTLCEVQIFGADLVECNAGYYSTSNTTCEPCNTCYNDRCDPDTGECTDGCKVGYYGDYCEDQCNDGCSNNQCNEIHGSCACKGGYYGDFCEDQCSGGCSNNQCNEIDGTCACKDGYYGDTCEQPCSANCKDGKCSNTSSFSSPECTDGCIDGYKDSYCQSPCHGNCKTCQQDGSSCTACNPGWFGTNCISSCSSNCVRGCDKIGGRCVECKPDTVGLYCNLTCGTGCQPITDPTTVTCDRNGTCTNCIIGRYGDTCDSECTGCDGECARYGGRCTDCTIGRYDDRCDKNCSTGCDGGCGRDYGRCTKCIDGRYGAECYDNCSTGCDGGCDQSTGNCINGCLTGKIGSNCTTDCAVGRYGNKCTSKCGNCADKTPCDVITGSCGPIGCADGFQGPTCHERVPVATSTALSPVYAVIGVICVILCTILVFLPYHFYKKRRQSTPRSSNEEIELDYNYSNTDLIPTSSTTYAILNTGNQNISTNTRNVDYVNQSFNTEDDTICMIHYNTPDDTNNSIHL